MQHDFKRAATAAAFILAGAGTAGAQSASAPVPATAPATSDCSGIMCLFSSGHRGSAPAPANPAPADASGQQAGLPTAPVKQVAQAPKPVRPVTIAADESETVRLKALAASLPKTKIRFVKDTAAKHADLVVTKSVDGSSANGSVRLFSEQMQIVAGPDVHSLADLKGKAVSFGPDGGAAQAVSRRAFQAAGVEVAEAPLDYANAFDGLSSGDIAAVVVLEAEPSRQIKALQSANLHLVAWPEGIASPNGTSLSAVAPGTYPKLQSGSESVRVLGVDAVLEPKASALRQPVVKRFLASLADHSAALSKLGFDRLRADVMDRSNRRVASAERR